MQTKQRFDISLILGQGITNQFLFGLVLCIHRVLIEVYRKGKSTYMYISKLKSLKISAAPISRVIYRIEHG